MAKFRLDMLLKRGDAGASETYWIEPGDFFAAKDQAVALATLRKALLSSTAIVQGWRITPVNTFGMRAGRQKSKNATTSGYVGPAGTTRDQNTTSLLTSCTDSDEEVSKTNHLRFLPDAMISYDANDNFNTDLPSLLDAFQPYQTEIENGTYFMRNFDDDPNANPNNEFVQTVTFDSDGLMSVTLGGPMADAEPGMRVKIQHYSGAFTKQVNGLRKILGIAGATLTLDVISCQFKNSTGPGGGARAFLESYRFTPINSCTIYDARSHDTGRAFFLQRGRRGKKPKCLFTPAVASVTS